MISLKPHEQRVQDPLDDPHRQHGASHVLEQHQTPAAPEHARGLCDGSPLVGYGAQRERHYHRVEGFLGEGKRCGIAYAQVGLYAQLPGTIVRDREHRWA
jgi:hypothetical protein